MITEKDFISQAKAGISKKIDRMASSGKIKNYDQETLDALIKGASRGIDRNVEFKQRFGSFYRYADIGKLLGVTRQAVNQKKSDSKILVVTTKDGTKLCPAFQFVNGEVEKPVSNLINILLSGGMDPWSALYWLTTPLPECDNKTAIEALYTGNGYSAILNGLAREDVAHWAM